MKKIFRFLASLKLAVLVIVGLAVAQAVATFIESATHTKAAQYWVYRSYWFYGLLFLLGVNIAAVALSRYPWKKKHGPFLTAHVGILMLLFGSFLTFKFGVDGNLVVSENEASTKVSFDNQVLIVSDGEKFSKHVIPWIPTQKKFNMISIPQFGINIERYITHAEPVYDFQTLTAEDEQKKIKNAPAVQFKLKGGPLPFSRLFWLWGGAGEWSQLPLGPARFEILPPGSSVSGLAKLSLPEGVMGRFVFLVEGEKLHYGIYSRKPAKLGSISLKEIAEGKKIELGWMGMEMEIKKFLPQAKNAVYFQESRLQKGNEAPPSAIFLKVGEGEHASSTWMGLEDQVVLHSNGKKYILTYTKEYLNLPFSIKLLNFKIENYQGSLTPAAYSSQVQVIDGTSGAEQPPVVISMNEPLYYNGFTFYQASFIPGEPRPTTSVFSVNKDPGRIPKYLGSLLIVFGSGWLFSQRYRKKKKEVSNA